MKPKHFATIILASLLIVTVFGSVTVFAPPPTTPNPNSILDVFVTNTSDDPVPVDITDDTIDVNLDEPIEVTNPSGESLNIDVSGWLHTTQWDKYYFTYPGDELGFFFEVKTEGYRQIAIGVTDVYGADFTFSLVWAIGNETDRWRIYDEEFTVSDGTQSFLLTREVVGSYMLLWVISKTPGDAYFAARYYLTT